ncbi:glycosyltransferase family 4 protein [Vibrio vulnificus]|uniref:glycosyltransferase family 4 protein n=1 Tax=Vibrio TaxID=662 RepID=UPI001A1EB5DB|nr:MULTISPECIES: glycosyltransferase family 4 protein [Vibrio]ELK8588959.1 glycosyltransferase family 4 protein [Vibrio vulnificus]MCJ0818774.1 glycosyltransferase family 4 protein [Vibrio vulnificus]MDC8109755.1 glycosyltransferase family 4 protein [Vibrio sp. CCUG 15886]HAS6358853.1 glycosyltransferase [Vibrio vulnificus]HDY7607433.1 glycosyltransferase family 4 protein [Vibrio vulnificus]
MKKKKLLIVQEYLMHYRVDLFNLIAQEYDLTVVSTDIESSINTEMFKFRFIKQKKKSFFKFIIFPKFESIIKEVGPDCIIATFDLRLISIILFFIKNKKLSEKLIWWGLDKGASDIALKIKLWIANYVNCPIIFYSKYNQDRFVKLGLSKGIARYATNTFPISNNRNTSKCEKKHILFVGSFDERKGIPILIRAFKKLTMKMPDVSLVLVGDGDVYNEVKEEIHVLGLTERVNMVGRINDPEELSRYYEEAFVSVSYSQAGLSVLQSLAFGVPFITHRDSISGSEKYNIIDGFNGYFVDNENDLVARLTDIIGDLSNRVEISDNAYRWFEENCTIENMARQITDVIDEA